MKSPFIFTLVIFNVSFGYAQKDSLVAPWWVEKFRLTAGIFVPVNDTKIQVSANGTAGGTEIDFQKDLGLNSTTTTFLANAQWRISRRSRLTLGYYNIRRGSTHTLERDITFDSTTYDANISVSSYFNTAIYQFSYGYAFIVQPNYEIGVSIGAHTVGATAGIAVNTANGGQSKSTSFGFTAPLPDLGIWGGYAFSNRFAVNLDFSYLSLTVDNTNGRIISYNLILSYKIIRQLDISLAYTGLDFSVHATKKDVTGTFKWGYNGPSLGATYSFGRKSWKH